MKARKALAGIGILLLGSFAACAGERGTDGTNGSNGEPGRNGEPGKGGEPGEVGAAGEAGAPGSAGEAGPPGSPGKSVPDPDYPRSGVVALALADTSAASIPEAVKAKVVQYGSGTLPAGTQFPLVATSTDGVRALAGLTQSVVVKWLDPLRWDGAPTAPRFGANADYIAYFGDGWAGVAGSPPQWNGSGTAAWIWVNHEYISGTSPTATTDAKGQQLFFAQTLQSWGVLTNDVNASTWADEALGKFIAQSKRQVGGSWLHIVQDPSTLAWSIDRSATALRYDASDATLIKVSGTSVSAQKDDKGAGLPAGVVVGTLGNCSGGQTPWGTVLTGEENTQDYYGDLEACWNGDQKFVAGAGCDKGADLSLVTPASTSSEYGKSPDAAHRKERDAYGWMVEMDPGVAATEYEGRTTPGTGHKKLGALGRARWEMAGFVVDPSWKLPSGKPLVLYASEDRRGGRVFKFVSKEVYTTGMTKAQTRALLDQGTLYVAHFAGLDNLTGDTLVGGAVPTEAAPGTGRWLKLSVDSTDVAPNAATLGAASKTVGEALKDKSWNGLGGFPTDDAVRKALFTACNKVGVMELNRPEDAEWNPKDPSGKPRLYIAFTNHTGFTALDQNGKMFDPATHATDSKKRPDAAGSIFALEEADPTNPAASSTFKYLRVWKGSTTPGLFATANPDNLVIDKDGGVWFGTDGAFKAAKQPDALYYLDLDPAHKALSTPTYGLPFRVVTMPSDAEATGPAFSSDMRTLFVSVQHPGEDVYSSWPGR